MRMTGNMLALLAGGLLFATAQAHAQGSKGNDTKKSAPKADPVKPAQPPARTTTPTSDTSREKPSNQSRCR